MSEKRETSTDWASLLRERCGSIAEQLVKSAASAAGELDVHVDDRDDIDDIGDAAGLVALVQSCIEAARGAVALRDEVLATSGQVDVNLSSKDPGLLTFGMRGCGRCRFYIPLADEPNTGTCIFDPNERIGVQETDLSCAAWRPREGSGS